MFFFVPGTDSLHGHVVGESGQEGEAGEHLAQLGPQLTNKKKIPLKIIQPKDFEYPKNKMPVDFA